MNILEELWYGNIYSSERPIKKDSEYAKMLRNVAQEIEMFLNTLPPDAQKTAGTLMDIQEKLAVIAQRDAFVEGFSLACQMLVQSLCRQN